MWLQSEGRIRGQHGTESMIAVVEVETINPVSKITLATPKVPEWLVSESLENLSPVEIRFPDAPVSAFEPITAAPQPDTSIQVAMRPYAVRAGLLPGEGATVVLRIQILDSGKVGKILVDVSSGQRQIDSAAVAYARSHRWVPAKSGNRPQTVWIQFGVRLQA